MAEFPVVDMIEPLERALRALLKGEHVSLSISFNEMTAMNYKTVAAYVEQFGDEHFDWVSDDEKAKAIATNSAWTIQWYPHTQVGFHRMSASSLSALLKAALSE